MPRQRTLYFPMDDKHVVVDEPLRGFFIAHLRDDMGDYGRIRAYGTGDGILDAIADLNNELEQVE